MADWFYPALPTTGKPVTAEWGAAVQENPVAIAEGAPGAPRVQSMGMGKLRVFASTIPADTTPVEIVGLDAVSTLNIYAANQGTDSGVQISATSDGGVSWGAWQTVIGNAAGVSFGTISLPSGDFVRCVITGTPGHTTSTLQSNINGLRFRKSSASVVSTGYVWLTLTGRAA